MKKLLFKLLAKVDNSIVDEYIRQRWVKPVGFEDLTLAFVDDNGLAWYEFAEGMGNPIKRIEQQSQFVSFLSARLSPEAVEIAYEAIKTAFNEGNYLEGLVVFKRFMDMRDNIIPMDVMINALAADFIREDESITEPNPVIHQQKCDYLMKVAENGDSFFFRLQGVKDLSERFKISTDSWKVISKGFRESLKELKRETELIRSMNLDSESQETAQPLESSSETT